MRKVARFLRTVRHLRWSQIVGQVRVRLLMRLADPKKFRSYIDKELVWPIDCQSTAVKPPTPSQDPRAIAQGSFLFIGISSNLGLPVDWSADDLPRLWRYNLHYFDWLWNLFDQSIDDYEIAKGFVSDWIANHPLKKGACGWEPYPTSLRLINWSILFGRQRVRERDIEDEFDRELIDSITKQTAWLEKNLETHIQANHLFENLAALLVVGSVFEGSYADDLTRRYLPRLRRELEEQILPDGLHYERSPMYHLRMLWLVEMLSLIGRSEVQGVVEAYRKPMKKALEYVRHPDGEIALLNDAAIGIYADHWREQSPRIGSWSLPDAGYFGCRSINGDYLIVDSGPIGPDHQPGHAHADLFTFELSLGGLRLITDTGTGTYEISEERSYQRSTAAHNTVSLNRGDSVEVWSGFRVGRRVKPVVEDWNPSEGRFELKASHAGFCHLPGKPRHSRIFDYEEGRLVLVDRVESEKEVSIRSFLHFGSNVLVTIDEKGIVRGSCESRSFSVKFSENVDIDLIETGYSPRFGLTTKRCSLVVDVSFRKPSTEWRTIIEW